MVLRPLSNEDYFHWIYRHHSAFIINLDTNGKNQSVAHTARCMHLYEPDPRLNHVGQYGKACSDSLPKLLEWASENGHQVTECTTCTPYDHR